MMKLKLYVTNIVNKNKHPYVCKMNIDFLFQQIKTCPFTYKFSCLKSDPSE